MWRASLKKLAAAIRGHPQFTEAARRSVSELVAWRSQLGVTNRVVSKLGRESIIELLLILSFARGVGDQPGGANFERLAALSESRGARRRARGQDSAAIASDWRLCRRDAQPPGRSITHLPTNAKAARPRPRLLRDCIWHVRHTCAGGEHRFAGEGRSPIPGGNPCACGGGFSGGGFRGSSQAGRVWAGSAA
jgi:hypothetical protein